MKYKKVLRDIDPSKFAKLRGSNQEKSNILYDNLWVQFGLTKEVRDNLKEKGIQCCVSDYAWTSQAKETFYSHPEHERFVSEMTKTHHFSMEMWKLNAEPDNEMEEG